MFTQTKKVAYWAAVIGLGTFVMFTLSFIAILFVNPPFTWTDMDSLLLYTKSNPQAFKYLGMLSMLLYSLIFVVIVLCERSNMQNGGRLFADIAAAFALAFCVCICLNYFIQLTATRLQIMQGVTEGVSQFTQSFPISALSAVNMLGWTVFYGLSTAFLYLAYRTTGEAKVLRRFCLINSAFMLISAVGYAFQCIFVLALCMNMGLGAAGFGMLWCLIRKQKVLLAIPGEVCRSHSR
jgi:hypothetical protein